MVGQNIGKYRVLDRIGRGGMGTVYRAIDETLHREVAIKVLNAELNDPEIARRFRTEAITVARLSHPGIATIYELFQHDGQWLMVMEFVRGETLERMVDRVGALSPQQTAELCMQTLAALAHAHSMGVVHRDLKPANIMITESGAIKVMDFGIARVAGTEHLTSAGFMMGTPAYMAPEQVMGKEIDARADLYAIGVVFYRLTTGKLPFKGETPFAMAQSQVNDPPTPIGLLRSDLPAWVEQIVVRALAKNPDERFQSAAEFHEGFARSLSSFPGTAGSTSAIASDLLATPSRPMPSGAIPRPVTSSYPMPTAAQPAVQPVVPAPTPDLGATVLSATAETALYRSGAVAGGPADAVPAEPAPTMATRAPLNAPQPADTPSPAPSAPAVLAASATGTGKAAAAKRGSGGLIAGAAVAVVVVAVAAVLIMRSPAPAPAAPPQTSAEPVAATQPDPVPPAVDPPPESTAPGAPAVTVTAPPRAAREGRSIPAPAPEGSGRAAATATSTSTGAAAPVPPIDDTTMSVVDVKLLIVKGRDTDDEDVTLRFGDGEIGLFAKRNGSKLAAMPYSSTLRATYTRARDPKWDALVFGPPQNLDVGGPLRTSKHWLVLQASDGYLILRLEDKNFRSVIDTVTARTRIAVARPSSPDKP